MSTTAAQLARIGRTSGLCNRIEAFYRANPDEELTFAMIETKFGCTKNSAIEAVNYLRRRDGLLESVHVVRMKAKGRAS